jgi:hypothetical protein
VLTRKDGRGLLLISPELMTAVAVKACPGLISATEIVRVCTDNVVDRGMM